MRRFLSLPLLLVLLLALAAPAHASRDQMLTFEAPRDLLDPATRDGALAEMDSLGVKAIRQVMYWHDVAPAADAAAKPDFDTTDPASYDFSRYDAVVDAARARGWKVLLTVSGPVPKWATDKRRDTVTNPDPSEFAQFMTAVGRHFGDRVAIWSVWNEPNHPQFLRPQYNAKHKPVSPRIYRELVKAALKGLASAKVPHPTVLMGETAPVGTGKDVAPLTFLRGALCLDSHYKKSKRCGKLAVSGYAHHAYTTRQGPFYRPASPNNVTIGVLGRLTRALDRAGAAGAIPPKLPVYLTEFGIQSTPDPLYGVSYQQQAEYRALSERIAYFNPRVKSFSQYLLRDDNPIAGVPRYARYAGFESGLRTAGGKAKTALPAFRLTLTATRSGRNVSLWGLVRPATGVTTAVVQVRNGAHGAFKDYKSVTTNALGYFSAKVAYRRGRQFRLRWVDAAGTTYRGGPTRIYRAP